MSAADVEAIQDEITQIAGALRISWADIAKAAQLKMAEATLNGGITSYTINGRTVTRDLRWWQEAYRFAMAQAAVDDEGGIVGCPISFQRPIYRSPNRRNL